ncbi:heavy-metal-associated domain-containing protein [Propionivibrio limicola]|uniref:heavy-metal-associated domain-containing protein n=1 Tax=Propionivibrio limicola TaxID=167645 RepID=UPI0012911D08|nr:cation transporter [Propionivibrio limicola]
MQHWVIGIAGMSCQGCVKNLTGVLQALPGVSAVTVTLEPAQAEIDFDPDQVTPPQFKAAIEDAGFDVV